MASHDVYRQDIFERLLLIVRGDIRATEVEVRNRLWNEVKDDAGIFQLLFDNWFIRNYAMVRDRLEVRDGVTVYRPPHKRPDMRTHVDKGAKALRNLVLMDLVMANGKQLRDCTFGELATITGWARDLCKHGKPQEVVGKKLTEEQVRNIWKRHAIKNGKQAA